MLRNDESLDDLILGGFHIIQPRAGYRFSIDAVLLAHFVEAGPQDTIIDLGSGNGVIPLLLAARYPQAQIIGVELQPQMTQRALRSVELNGLGHRVRIINADIRRPHPELGAAIAEQALSNPPFWKENEGKVSAHPEAAIARHELALKLEQLVPAAARLLKEQGRFAMIHRAARLPEILTLLNANQLRPRRLRLVHPSADRPAALVLIEAQKGGSAPLTALPPLILRQDNGTWSPEIQAWYGKG